MTAEELLGAARNLRVHTHHGVRAPYKALTLLWMVNRYLSGRVPVAFAEPEHELTAILQPHRIAGSPPEARHPFFHLGSEPALWRIRDAANDDRWHKVRRIGGSRRPAAARMRAEAVADLSPGLSEALHHLSFRSAFVRELLSEWPATHWDSILASVGLDPGVVAPPTE